MFLKRKENKNEEESIDPHRQQGMVRYDCG